MLWSTTQRLQQLWTSAVLRCVHSSALINRTSSYNCQRSFHHLRTPTTTTTIATIGKPLATTIGAAAGTQPLLLQCLALPMVNQTCGFKFKRVLKRRCRDCYFVVRQNRLQVICKTHPRHKQLAITAPEESSWILTHAMQSPVRPY